MIQDFLTDVKQKNTLNDEYYDFNNTVSHLEPLEQFDVEEIKRQLLLNIRSCLSYLLPNGTFHKNEFQVGDVWGNKGKSLRVELSGSKAGLWNDFATGDGGDIIDLWAAVHRKNARTEFSEVMASISEWLGKQHTREKKSIKDLEQYMTCSWNYYDENNQVIVIVYRYDPPEGKKEYRPFDVKKLSFGEPDIRPLYNIPGILKSDKIILVEGEKCAEALIEQGITATTAMFGANAPIEKTDWSPLKGKHVIIWPDNDESGEKYAEKATKKLVDIGVASLSILKIPQDKPNAWDVADGVLEGMNVEEFILNNKSPYSPRKSKRIDTTAWTNTPPERKWIIKDWLPVGSVTALYGDGGVGKSLLAQQLMTAAAAGKPWLGIDLEQIKTYGVFCEDDEEELWRRQCAINEFYQSGMESSDFQDNVGLWSRAGHNNQLMVFNNKDTGQLTTYFQELLEDIESFQPKLVVLDTAADLFGGNENDRSHVRQFIQTCCGRIAQVIKGAVLLLAHPSDSGMIRKTGTGGSTAWNNTVRSRWYLTRPDKANASPDERILSRKKSNYSQCNNGQMTLYWKNGAFVHDNSVLNSEPIIRDQYSKKLDLERMRKHEVILSLIRSSAYQGNIYTAGQFAKRFEGEEGLGSERNIRERINNLATLGQIKFFRNAEEYGISNTNSKYGFLCVKDMELKVSIEGKVEYKLVKPTHHYLLANGVVLPIKDLDVL
ncbi:MAG: AAA family ATPase [Wolbachia sp.]